MHAHTVTTRMTADSICLLAEVEKENLPPGSSRDYFESGTYALLVGMEGAAQLQLNGERYRLGKESCWILEPHQQLSILTDEKAFGYYRLTFRMVELPDSEGAGIQEEGAPVCVVGELVCTPFSRLVKGIEEIYSHCEETDRRQRYYHRVRFEELLCYLFAQNAWSQKFDPQKAVEQSIAYVEAHYQEQMTVDQLAADAHVPRWRYTQLFKEMTGQLPLDYINQLRISRAKQLLLVTGDRIQEIAQSVGFNNEYYFNRRFKQTVGLAPGKYRNVRREDLRVVSIFMEDYLMALEIKPIVQWAHTYWGKQDYLGLHDVPAYNILTDEVQDLSLRHPDFIMLRECTGWRSNLYKECSKIARTCVINQLGPQWRTTMRILGESLDREAQAKSAIEQYDRRAEMARSRLARSMSGQTVAFLRVCAGQISVEKNYSYAVLFEDLGLVPHPLVNQLSQKEARAGVSWELLSRLDADHLFFTFDKWHDAGEGAERLEILHPSWQALPAVQKKQAYEVDFMTWMNHGPITNQRKLDDVLQILA